MLLTNLKFTVIPTQDFPAPTPASVPAENLCW